MTDENANTTLLPPFDFEPIIKKVIWGGSFIKYFKGIPQYSGMPVGEAWEVSGLEGDESVVASGDDKGLTLPQLIDKYGERLVGGDSMRRYGKRFPLLVKFIDAARDLSVQVHPDDRMASELGLPCGKNELWHLLRCRGGARIYAGFSHDFSPEEYDKAVADGSIMKHVTAHRAKAGDTFYLPAGTIHSIGAGNFLIEVQQTSGTTFRVYDFDRRDDAGNKRELHTDLARRALSWNRYAPEKFNYIGGEAENRTLVMCDWTHVRRHEIHDTVSLLFPKDCFTIISCISGDLTLTYPGTERHMRMGQTLLIPAEVDRLTFSGRGSAISVTL